MKKSLSFLFLILFGAPLVAMSSDGSAIGSPGLEPRTPSFHVDNSWVSCGSHGMRHNENVALNFRGSGSCNGGQLRKDFDQLRKLAYFDELGTLQFNLSDARKAVPLQALGDDDLERLLVLCHDFSPLTKLQNLKALFEKKFGLVSCHNRDFLRTCLSLELQCNREVKDMQRIVTRIKDEFESRRVGSWMTGPGESVHPRIRLKEQTDRSDPAGSEVVTPASEQPFAFLREASEGSSDGGKSRYYAQKLVSYAKMFFEALGIENFWLMMIDGEKPIGYDSERFLSAHQAFLNYRKRKKKLENLADSRDWLAVLQPAIEEIEFAGGLACEEMNREKPSRRADDEDLIFSMDL